MNRNSGLKILKQVTSIPTAPFVERHVEAYIRDFVKARKNLRLSRDDHGNLLITLPGRSGQKLPRWVFTAHMDHPGFRAGKMLDAKTLEAHFHGWVLIEYVRGTKVRFFDAGKEIAGKVIQAGSDTDDRQEVPSRVKVRVSAPVSPGSPGMFDQGEARIEKGKLYSRGCDDQAGLAGALAMLDELHERRSHGRPPKATIALLCTRAEEEGFIGALAAVEYPKLLKKTDCLIAIECSAMQPYAPQGEGAIIRVGDKSSIFNSQITYFLNEQAEELKKKDRAFKVQRALMPGGTCEATVYDAWGYQAGSICVPLGNYHNMDKDKKKIAPEYIDINDWLSMTKLFIRVAEHAHEYQPGMKPLKARVLKRFAKLRRLL